MTDFRSIVLSGNPGAGKSTLAKMLSDEYEWPVVSVGGIWRGKWKELYPNGERTFEDYWAGTTVEENRKMNELIKGMYEGGDTIGDSRFVSYLDRGKCLLVFLYAELGIRAKRAMMKQEYLGKGADEIGKIFGRREADEVKMGKELFGVDYRDLGQYHAVLNTGILTPAEEFRMIKGCMDGRSNP